MRLDDSAVVRRFGSGVTHVAKIGPVERAHLIADYWALGDEVVAACGVRVKALDPIMHTGIKVTCRACAHVTGITEQSPAVHEKLEGLL